MNRALLTVSRVAAIPVLATAALYGHEALEDWGSARIPLVSFAYWPLVLEVGLTLLAALLTAAALCFPVSYLYRRAASWAALLILSPIVLVHAPWRDIGTRHWLAIAISAFNVLILVLFVLWAIGRAGAVLERSDDRLKGT